MATTNELATENRSMVTIVIRNQQGFNSPPMKLKRTDPLRKVLDFYGRSEGAEPGVFVYLWDGRRILGHETPNQLELEDEDQIDALKPAYGGGK